MISKLTLGSAQFGMNYGINNKCGKPSKAKVFEILDYAYEKDIKSIDTAMDYGNSEKLIGEWIKINNLKDVFITTKIKVDCKNFDNEINRKIEESLNSLNINNIDNLMIHNFGIFQNYSDKVLDKLNKIKKSNKIKKYGFSLYSPQELKKLIKYDFDTIQIPINIFDQRFLKSGLLKIVKQKNVIIFSRSIFLQGLFFMDLDNMPQKLRKIEPYLLKLKELIDKYDLKLESLLFNFVKSINYIDSIVFGIDSIAQLKENIKSYNKSIEFNIVKEISKEFSDIPYEIIDPRNW